MALNIRRIGSTFAAEVAQLDLRQPLDEMKLEEIEDALAEHGVVVPRAAAGG